MIDKNVILAHFWANKNELVTADGVAIDLHYDKTVVVSTTLKNTTGFAREIQMMAEFELDVMKA